MSDSHYKIVANEDRLRNFIDWLPHLKKDEVFYGVLMARRKYSEIVKNVKSDSEQLARFYSTKEELFDKIKQLEVPLGSYKLKGVVMPNESLVFYINPNPRSLKKAIKACMYDFVSAFAENKEYFNPLQNVLTNVHREHNKLQIIGFDYDHTEYPSIIETFVNKESLTVTKTKGGFHIFVNKSKLDRKYNNSFYNNIGNLPHIDITGDFETVACGCYQGGFEPYHLNFNN